MSAHVLLNLLNKFGESDKMGGLSKWNNPEESKHVSVKKPIPK